jgi:hypothetical protein
VRIEKKPEAIKVITRMKRYYWRACYKYAAVIKIIKVNKIGPVPLNGENGRNGGNLCIASAHVAKFISSRELRVVTLCVTAVGFRRSRRRGGA